MKKKLNAIIAVLLSVACLPVAPLGANAMVQSSDGYDISSEGIVYSLNRDIVEEDMLPPLGETMIESYFLQSAMNENPSAKFAVEIDAYVVKNYNEEEKQFQAEHFMDGKSYAEILDTLNEKSESQYTKEEKELAWQIWGETHDYSHVLYEEQQKNEPEWLKEQGIDIVSSDESGMFNYAIVTREQLENFPVSETSGYKIFLAPLSAVDETARVNSQKIGQELKEHIGFGETKITVAVWYESADEDYTTTGKNIISEMEIPDESVKYICMMFDNPALICELSPKQIIRLSNRDDVLKLNYHNDLDGTEETSIPHIYDETAFVNSQKIGEELKEHMESGEASIPVVITHHRYDSSEISAIVQRAWEEVKETYQPPTEEATTPQELDALRRKIESEKANLYQKTRLDTIKNLYATTREKIISETDIPAESVISMGTFSPLLICELSPKQIVQLSNRDDVEALNYYNANPEEDETSETYVTLAEIPYDIGDVDGDGAVSIVDVLSLNKYLLGVHNLSDSGKISADVNGDGVINDADSMMILKSVVGLAKLS